MEVRSVQLEITVLLDRQLLLSVRLELILILKEMMMLVIVCNVLQGFTVMWLD